MEGGGGSGASGVQPVEQSLHDRLLGADVKGEGIAGAGPAAVESRLEDGDVLPRHLSQDARAEPGVVEERVEVAAVGVEERPDVPVVRALDEVAVQVVVDAAGAHGCGPVAGEHLLEDAGLEARPRELERP